MLLISLLSLGLGASAWVLQGRFVPEVRGAAVAFGFVPAPAARFAFCAAVALIALTLVRAAVRRPAPVSGTARPVSRDDDACLVPLLLCVVPAAAPLVLLPGVARALPAAAYVLIDLRAWWIGTGLALWLVAVDRRLAGAPYARIHRMAGRLPPRARTIAADAVLGVLVIAFAIASTPRIRFTADLHGDEPKYLRYCENFYQGRGFDLSTKQPLGADWRQESPALLHNFRLLADGVAVEGANLLADVRAAMRDPRGFTWVRAHSLENWFLRGKNGGFYQVHNPGLPFLMCGAYTIDRAWLGRTIGYQGEFPAELRAVNGFFLGVHALWAVALVGLLRRVARPIVAWGLTAAAMLSLPVGAMPFQFYPEALAGLVVTLVAHRLLFDPVGGRGRALWYGLMIGWLPWLHVRFLILSLVLVGWALVARRSAPPGAAAAAATSEAVTQRSRLAGQPSVRWWCAVGYAVAFAALCLYAYGLTGSPRPDAMYRLPGGVWAFRWSEVPMGLVAYVFDRVWGLFAHAPLYLLALAGTAALWRRDRRAVVFLALVWLALAVPSAGHGLAAGGASPLRHLSAVVPLAMLPIAALLERRPGGVAHIGLVFLLALSVQNAAAYNRFHLKEIGRMIDRAGTGWKTNLLFPWTHGEPWESSQTNFALFLCWSAASAALLVWLRARPMVHDAGHEVPQPSASGLVGAAVALPVVLVLAGALTSALTGDRLRADYLPLDASHRDTPLSAQSPEPKA